VQPVPPLFSVLLSATTSPLLLSLSSHRPLSRRTPVVGRRRKLSAGEDPLTNANTLQIAPEGARPRSRGGQGRRDVATMLVVLIALVTRHRQSPPLRFYVEPGGCAARCRCMRALSSLLRRSGRRRKRAWYVGTYKQTESAPA
jgi:hypothetical protein